jgi:integrase
MPLYRRPNSPHLWVRGSVAGEKYRLSSGTDDEVKAEEFEHALRERLWRQRKLGDRGAISVREAARKWLKLLTNKTAPQDRSNIEWFLSVQGLADASLSEVTLEVNEELQATLLATGKAKGTVDRYMACWRRLLRKCTDWGYLVAPPKVPMFNEDVGEPRWLTPEEFARLRSQLPRHLDIAARFAVYTGLRMRAQLSLRWAHVDLKNKRAWIEARFMKAGKTHGFPLSAAAIEALKDARKFQADQEVEHHRRCERLGLKFVAKIHAHVFTYRGKPIDDCNGRAYQEALQAAKIEGADWHTLRHTFASWAVQGGVTLHELMLLGPWESYDMVLRYAHLAPDRLGPAVTAVARMGHTARRARSARKKNSR